MSQKFVDFTSVRPVDLSFLKKWKISLEATPNKPFNICVSPWLLTNELITGKSEYFKSFVSILLVQLHKLRIDTFGERSLRCHIDNHYAFSPFSEDAKPLDLVTIDIHGWNVVERCELRSQVLFIPPVQGHKYAAHFDIFICTRVG